MKQHFEQWQAGRESRASTYFSFLFGSAVITILGIRAFLAATGYPQIGGGNLHIAHMLWGGLLLLVAVIVLIYFHGHRAKVIGSLLAGVGFGFFIDELGKFITSDNDYFYEPTAMLIYIFFILLWALFNWLDNYRPTNNRQVFVDTLTRLRDATVHGVTPKDRQQLNYQLTTLKFSPRQRKKIISQIEKYAPVYSDDSINAKLRRFSDNFDNYSKRIINTKLTKTIVYAVVTINALVVAGVFIFSAISSEPIWQVDSIDAPAIVSWGLTISSGISTGLILIGFWYSNRDWLKVLIWYRRGVIVNIFGVQVFLFYTNQFAAAFGLFIALVILYVLTYLIDDINSSKQQEQESKKSWLKRLTLR